MTEDQKAKYEEAANKLFPFFDNQPAFNQYMQAKREAFVGGCEFASHDAEDHMKQAYNKAIEKALDKILNHPSRFDMPEDWR